VTRLPVIRAAGMSTRRRLNTVTFVALKTSDSGPQRAELQRQQDDDTALTHLLPHNINTTHTAQQRTVVESSSKSPTMRTRARLIFLLGVVRRVYPPSSLASVQLQCGHLTNPSFTLT